MSTARTRASRPGPPRSRSSLKGCATGSPTASSPTMPPGISRSISPAACSGWRAAFWTAGSARSPTWRRVPTTTSCASRGPWSGELSATAPTCPPSPTFGGGWICWARTLSSVRSPPASEARPSGWRGRSPTIRCWLPAATPSRWRSIPGRPRWPGWRGSPV